MPQVFWATCPQCAMRFTADRLLWENNWRLRCPKCLRYFSIYESPHVQALWSGGSGPPGPAQTTGSQDRARVEGS